MSLFNQSEIQELNKECCIQYAINNRTIEIMSVPLRTSVCGYLCDDKLERNNRFKNDLFYENNELSSNNDWVDASQKFYLTAAVISLIQKILINAVLLVIELFFGLGADLEPASSRVIPNPWVCRKIRVTNSVPP